MLLGQEGACTQEEARTRDTRRSGDVAESEAERALAVTGSSASVLWD